MGRIGVDPEGIRAAFQRTDPRLFHGESIVWQRRCTRIFRRRQQGGVLYLTDRRLLFMPSVLDANRGAIPSDLPRERIAALGIEERTLNPLKIPQGGLARRLRVEERDGWSTRIFIVPKLDESIAELRALGLP